MGAFTFKAIGTEWYISADAEEIMGSEQEAILGYVADFERRFSRFKGDSEVNAFRTARAGTYPVTEEFAVLLAEANRLRTLTRGVYDPASGELLERAGYNALYTMTPLENVEEFVLPRWSIEGTLLTLDGPTAFDLGGIGKGYCIDRVADLLRRMGHAHILVDAGGDIFASTKHDGLSWQIAIQYPGKPDTAAGMVTLRDQAIAVSDSFRRRWGKWHHVVDPLQKKSVERVTGAVAVASSAWYADCMTSALFLGERATYADAAETYDAQYLVFQNDGTNLVSQNWEGELF